MSSNTPPLRLDSRTSFIGKSVRGAPIMLVVMFSLFLSACSKTPDSGSSDAQKLRDAAKTSNVIALESPLAKAATKGNIPEVKELLDKGASHNVSDALGRTPLHMAAFYGHPRTAALLIARGADVSAKDRVGMTPLHAAVLAGSVQEIDLLLANKAEIDAVADTGATPLHLAAATGQTQLAKILIQRGANPLSKDLAGATPLFYAVRNQHPATISLFQQYDGKE